LRTCLGGGGIYKKGPYYTGVWRDDRWLVIGDKKFGVVSYVLVGGSGGIIPQKIFLYFSTPRTEMCAFSETNFWINSVTLCFDRPNLIS
jgi:hypothetical protein